MDVLGRGCDRLHHSASAVRDPRQRRILGIRNTLWTAWLRRPPGRGAAPDRRRAPGRCRRTGPARPRWPAAARAHGCCATRRVIPPRVEAARSAARHSAARRYVGFRQAGGLEDLANLHPQQPGGTGCAPWAWTRCLPTEPGGAANPAAAPDAGGQRDMPYATARCAIPVSLLIAIDAAATTAARSASPVAASTDAGLSPAACATPGRHRGRSAAFPLITTGGPSDSTRARTVPRARRSLLPLAAPGCTAAAAARGARAQPGQPQRAGSAAVHHATTSRRRLVFFLRPPGLGDAGIGGRGVHHRDRGADHRTQVVARRPGRCRQAATAGGGPRHGTGSSSRAAPGPPRRSARPAARGEPTPPAPISCPGPPQGVVGTPVRKSPSPSPQDEHPGPRWRNRAAGPTLGPTLGMPAHRVTSASSRSQSPEPGHP